MSSLTTIQPIRSIILHIRSKDAVMLDDDLNTHFEVNLKAPISIEPTEELHCFLSQAEIPYSFYCVSSDLDNNLLVYNDIETLTFPNQNYNPDELINTMNNDSSFNAKFTSTYNRFTNKITITNTTGTNQVINWTTSTINKILGFGSKTSDDTIAGSGTTISPDMVNLASVHSIMVHSSLSSANVLSTRSGNSTILQKISIDVNAYSIIYLNQDDFRTTNVSFQPVVDKITFKLTDQNNNLLNLNGINYEMSMIFNVYPKYNDVPPYQYSGNMDNKRNRNTPQFNRQNIIAPPPTLLPNIQRPLTRPEQQDIDSTHPVEGVSEIEHDSNEIILDTLLNIQSNL